MKDTLEQTRTEIESWVKLYSGASTMGAARDWAEQAIRNATEKKDIQMAERVLTLLSVLGLFTLENNTQPNG